MRGRKSDCLHSALGRARAVLGRAMADSGLMEAGGLRSECTHHAPTLQACAAPQQASAVRNRHATAVAHNPLRRLQQATLCTACAPLRAGSIREEAGGTGSKTRIGLLATRSRHLELARHGVHDAGLPPEVKLQPDLQQRVGKAEEKVSRTNEARLSIAVVAHKRRACRRAVSGWPLALATGERARAGGPPWGSPTRPARPCPRWRPPPATNKAPTRGASPCLRWLPLAATNKAPTCGASPCPHWQPPPATQAAPDCAASPCHRLHKIKFQ